MRFYGLALASAFILGACGGGDSSNQNDTAATATPAAGADAGTAGATAAVAPITGTTHTVRMVGDAQGYRFDPAQLTVKAGDGVKWVMVSGGPHNVAFDPAKVPAAAKGQLNANMQNQMGELSSPMFMNVGEEYIVSFANIPAGTYEYVCTPHLMNGMTGTITVQQ